MKSAHSGKPAQRFLNITHYLQSDERKKQTQTANAIYAKRCAEARAKPRVLVGFGVLTAREYAIYQRGRHNGNASGYDSGRRKGYAEALNETGDERQWRKTA